MELEPDYHIVVGVHGSVGIKGILKHPHGEPLYSAATVEQLVRERDELLALAEDAHEAWDKDEDARVGKLLLAMMDEVFRKKYRPDLAKVGDGDTA